MSAPSLSFAPNSATIPDSLLVALCEFTRDFVSEPIARHMLPRVRKVAVELDRIVAYAHAAPATGEQTSWAETPWGHLQIALSPMDIDPMGAAFTLVRAEAVAVLKSASAENLANLAVVAKREADMGMKRRKSLVRQGQKDGHGIQRRRR